MMLKSYLRCALAGLSLLRLAACEGCKPETPLKKDAAIQNADCLIDPLYDAASAQAIAPGEVVDGTLCPQGFDDRDFYRVTTGPGDGILEVHLYNDTGFTSVDLRAALLDASGTPTGQAFSNSNGTGAVTDLRGSFGVNPGTEYVIEISDEGADDGDPTNPYHLEVALSPEPDSNEPNNDATAASTPACAGETTPAYLATRGDQDNYRCNSSALPGRLKLRFIASAELGWQPRILISNDQGQALLDTEVQAKTDGSYDFQAAVAVTRYEADLQNPEQSETRSHTGDLNVLIEDIDGTLFNYDANTGRYDLTLSVDTGPSGDPEPAERNDSPGSSSSVGANSSTQAYLATVGDVDWYRVDPGGGNRVMEISLALPADGVVPVGTDPDRVGANIAIYDTHYNVDGNGNMVVVSGCTEGPTYAGQLARCSNYNSNADQCSGAHGDQSPVCLPGALCGELRHSRLVYQGADAQGNLQAATYKTAISIPQNHPVFIAVSNFQGQVFHDQQPYTLTLATRAEPDSHEPNDLPPALNREARYSSSANSIRQCNGSYFPVASLGGYSGAPACDHPSWTCPATDGGTVDVCDYSNTSGGSCLPWNNNSNVDGGMSDDPFTSLDCSGIGTGSYSVTGYLSFVGDRDYYSFNLPPGDIEVNIDVVGSGASSTGIEPAVFVFTGSRGRLYASFVNTARANAVSARSCTDWHDCCDNIFECDPSEVPCNNPSGGVDDGMCEPPQHCRSHTECPDNYLCIRERCFRDDDSHPLPNVTFGPEGGNCLVAPVCGEANPWIIEITDNAQNDYDLNMQYRLTVRWKCNCPETCGYCRAPLNYRGSTCSER